MLQESLIRAWKNRASLRDPRKLRPWLYRIATNVCLDHLKQQKRRQLAPNFIAPSDPAQPFPPPSPDQAWLEPYPDEWLPDQGAHPEQQLLETETVSLAFLASIQLLPPQQRAALILVDVLDWSAEETAAALGNSLSSVNSLLYRARKKLRERARPEAGRSASKLEEQDLLAQYLRAWERSDAEALSRILTEDAIFHMPPFPAWYAGREAIRQMTAAQLFGVAASWTLKQSAANRQPAFWLYRSADPQAAPQLFGFMLLRLSAAGIAEIAAFLDPQLLATLAQ